MSEDSMYVDKLLRQAVIRGFEEISKRIDRSLAQGDEIIALLKRLDEEVEPAAEPLPDGPPNESCGTLD
jgi:hypothetical protein